MKKILITGVNSYIGNSFKEYIESDYRNYTVEMLSTRDINLESKSFVGYDVVLHVAGIAHIKESPKNKKLYFEINRNLAINIANAAKKAGVNQFIILSSMSVYGKIDGVITKESMPQPISSYGKSKYEADLALEKMESSEFKIAILRPPMVYGKGCKGNYQMLRKAALICPFFPLYINKRSMIYIGNLCEFIKGVIDEEKRGIFFPQNKEYVCTSEMVKLIAKENKKFSIQSSMFNVFINKSSLSIIKKVFGNLIYEKVDIIDKFSFEESIQLSERI